MEVGACRSILRPKMNRRWHTFQPSTFTATHLFFYFVVILWPVIYLRVYS